ncbi:glycosyltransferase family 4 protein [Acidothermaceae bacterium B102]|nr:glycosyltransferase family 4 protein [Acidothermaceae bacterium B102]
MSADMTGVQKSDDSVSVSSAMPQRERRGPGRRLRVLIVGINYAPEHTGIAPYTTAFAEFLASHGHDVDVWAGVPSYPSWRVPAEYQWSWRRTETCNGVLVRRLRSFVPRSQNAVSRGLYELTFALRIRTEKVRHRPDVVVAVVPTLLSAWAAEKIAAKHRAPAVVWVQDLMGSAAAESGVAGAASTVRLVSAIERAVLRKAASTVVIGETFVRDVVGLGVAASDVVLVPNWTHVSAPKQERANVRKSLGWTDEHVVLHTGNMGRKQALEVVIEAAKLCDNRDHKCRFVLMGDGSQRKELERLAVGNARVQIVDGVDSDIYSDVLAAADVLLINERASVIQMSLPSKLTSYLVAGQPILAAVNDDGATAQELRRLGLGNVVGAGDAAALHNAAHAASVPAEIPEQRAPAHEGVRGSDALTRFIGLLAELTPE